MWRHASRRGALLVAFFVTLLVAKQYRKPGVALLCVAIASHFVIDYFRWQPTGMTNRMIAGDNYLDFALSDFIDHFTARGDPTVAAYDIDDPDRATPYGVIECENDQVTDFREKPPSPSSSLISTGCYAFPAGTLDRLSTYLSAGNNPDKPGWFLQWLHSREPLHAFTFDGTWFDIDTPESYLYAIAETFDGDATIDASATVEHCNIGDNVHVMGDAELINTTIEQSIVFPGATIRESTVRQSVLDENAVIDGVDIGNGVVASHTKIRS